jgi:hypothetical protein
MDCLVGESMLVKSSNCIVKPRFTWAGVVSHPDAGNQQQRKTERKKKRTSTPKRAQPFSPLRFPKLLQ